MKLLNDNYVSRANKIRRDFFLLPQKTALGIELRG